MDIMIRTNGNPSLFYLNHLFPLAILKEIVAMFLSVNGPGFAERNQELVRFVLNRGRKYLPPRYRFFAYYNGTGGLRYINFAGLINTSTGNTIGLSEITYPPLGYVLTVDSPPPDKRLMEITHFARYGYNEFKVMELRMPVLPVHVSFVPGDYRSAKEIEEQARRSKEEMSGSS